MLLPDCVRDVRDVGGLAGAGHELVEGVFEELERQELLVVCVTADVDPPGLKTGFSRKLLNFI